jgi:predicted nuclease of predicted toxin-antitoxin system
LRFFVDNNLSPKIARALNCLIEPDHEVIHLRDKYKPNIPDPEWMAALATEHQWMIISGDIRIRQNKAELAAWQEAGHTIFFLRSGWTNISPFEQASKIFHVFPDVIELAKRAAEGTGFEITVRGKVEQVYAPGRR